MLCSKFGQICISYSKEEITNVKSLQKNGWTDRQTERQTERQTDRRWTAGDQKRSREPLILYLI